MELAPLVLTSPQGRQCRIERPLFLAPMDGITDTLFRRLVVAEGGVGAVCSEFVRISVAPVPRRALASVFGEPLPGLANGLQLMAPDAQHMATTAVHAAACGADFLDLNFGCPVKRVVNKCAGSALLAHPDRMAAIVRAAVVSQPLPVTVKMRPGIADAAHLEAILDAVCEAGATLVALHARLRTQAATERPDWGLLERARRHLARSWPAVPLIGNGAISQPQDAQALLACAPCAGLMIGQAALANPWIFRQIAGGPAASVDEARAFIERYCAAVIAGHGRGRVGLGRIKQMIKYWRAADLFADPEQRQACLRCTSLADLLARLSAR